MGFLSKLFKSQTDKATQEWLKTATLQDLEDMEKQGCDVSEWKAQIMERDALQSKVDAARSGEFVDNSILSNPIDLSKLALYAQTPRSTDLPLCQKLLSNLPWFNKDEYIKGVSHNPMIYTAIVQANHALWEPGDYDFLPAVIVFAIDDAHRMDVNWAKQMAKTIQNLKDSAQVPEDCRKVINLLRDSQSQFCCKIGASISDGADAWCATYSFPKQKDLPRKCLPTEGVVPFILRSGPKEDHGIFFHDIPGSLYEA